MIANDLLNEIPAKLRYERVPLPDESNALKPWQEAISRYQKLDFNSDGLSSLLYGFCEGETPAAPTEEDWRHVEEWIGANEEALALLDEGIARGRLQLPLYQRRTLEPEPLTNTTIEMRDFGKLLSLRIRLALQRGNLTAAADDGVRLLRLSDLILRGEGAVIDMLIGTALRSIATDAMSELGARQDLPTSARRMLDGALASVVSLEEAIWSAARIDLCGYGLSTLALLPETSDAAHLRDCLLTCFYENGESLKSMAEILEEAPPDEAVLKQRIDQRKRQLTTLLEEHPRLFDRAATARLLGEMALSQLESSLEAEPLTPNWPRRWAEKIRQRWRPTVDEQLETAWPYALLPWYQLENFGDDEAAIASRQETIDMMSEWDPALFAMTTDRQVARCRQLLRSIDNPVGRVVAQSLVGSHLPRTLVDRYRRELAEAKRALGMAAA